MSAIGMSCPHCHSCAVLLVQWRERRYNCSYCGIDFIIDPRGRRRRI
jgi:hypothetical protein